MQNIECSDIFVIDDDSETCEFMHDMLVMWGYRAHTFQSMSDVSIHLRSSASLPTLLLVDLNIDGDQNGPDVISNVRVTDGLSNVKAIILTGDTSFRSSHCTIRDVDVLYKPIRPESLRQIIQATLASVNS